MIAARRLSLGTTSFMRFLGASGGDGFFPSLHLYWISTSPVRISAVGFREVPIMFQHSCFVLFTVSSCFLHFFVLLGRHYTLFISPSVQGILLRGAPRQMTRIETSVVVTGMQNVKSFWAVPPIESAYQNVSPDLILGFNCYFWDITISELGANFPAVLAANNS